MTTKFFMCPADYFGIDYEINPWMKVEIQADNSKAQNQWKSLYKIITEDVKADVVTMEPQKGLPDIVFTANAALIYKNTALVTSFRCPERQPESKFYADWFEANGFDVKFLPEDIAFEGAGDALFSGDVLYSGYVPRTDISSHAYISELLNIKVISLELIDNRFYHLDTCFCPLTDGYLMYYPDAFDSYGNQVIEANFPEEKLIRVNEEEALKFSCNAVNSEYNIVMNLTTDRLKSALKEKGFVTYETDLSEFMKAGGSSKCLTLKLN